MKKLFLFSLLALMPSLASAFDVEIDGIYFDLNSDTKLAKVISGSTRYAGDVVIPYSVSYNGVEYVVSSVWGQAFYGCQSLYSVIFPDSLVLIGNAAFSNCICLKSVDIPLTVNVIENSAFNNCTGLESVIFHGGVGRILGDAFSGCISLSSVNISDLSAWCTQRFSSEESNPLYYARHLYLDGEELTNLVVPDDVNIVNRYTFINCVHLSTVTIPSCVNRIYSSAFKNCTALTDFYSYAESVPTTDTDAFEGSNIASATLHVPESSLEEYKSQKPWSDFKEIVPLQGEGIPFISEAEEDHPVLVYGLNGQLNGQGIVIVKRGNKVKKVVVK
ncbi:MAG: leucine-rich repeat domain-containing protein [Bacteroidales bacterium]|nr:leucine-rich repeat domain-containing protein [Bacteroidales bacterium]